MNAFKQLGLEDHLVQAITDLGFETPSEVQEKTIPLLLDQEGDLVALAQTGTGKTAAFGFPMFQKIDVNSRTTQGLILSPTRELCLQITNEMKLYGKHCKGLNVTAIYGGASITDQAKQVKRGAQIIVATPGRMKDMISRRLVDISKIEYAVLDEADEMLNMGFYEDITSYNVAASHEFSKKMGARCWWATLNIVEVFLVKTELLLGLYNPLHQFLRLSKFQKVQQQESLMR